ncbi:MAG: hypothetical protein HQL55_15050 [Magnetococcales bacterium]|nr:hypothetical protein [Magnetococcales bacterium]
MAVSDEILISTIIGGDGNDTLTAGGWRYEGIISTVEGGESNEGLSYIVNFSDDIFLFASFAPNLNEAGIWFEQLYRQSLEGGRSDVVRNIYNNDVYNIGAPHMMSHGGERILSRNTYQLFMYDQRSTNSIQVGGGSNSYNGEYINGSVISQNGRYILFDEGGQLYWVDTLLDTETNLAITLGNSEAENLYNYPLYIYQDGSAVLFESNINNLVSGDENNAWDIFIWQDNVVSMVSTSIDGSPGGGVNLIDISGDGRYIYFTSEENLVANDLNDSED